jgi:hypothetical protein
MNDNVPAPPAPGRQLQGISWISMPMCLDSGAY